MSNAPRRPSAAPEWMAGGGERRVCRSCGNDVPREVARVMGDRDGCLPVCPECVSDVADRHGADRVERWGSALDVYSIDSGEVIGR